MLNRIIFTLLFAFVWSLGAISAQEKDPVLFSVGDEAVHLSEFKYIYSKTNGNNADFSKASVDEYLDLYIKFKLKVQKAKEMKIDTIPALQRELDGYRSQLSNSYLMDKTVRNQLLKTAYKRKKKDRHISHIMVAVSGRKQPKDTLVAYNKINAIWDELEGGADFKTLVASKSEDSYSNKSEGTIGWVTALLPNGFYAMENAAYNTPVGSYSKPFKTNMGYHVIFVNDTRKARGTMELAHILAFHNKEKPNEAKERMQKAYEALKAGGDFDQIARGLSDDKKSAAKGGYLGTFGIGVHEQAFEEAAFNLTEDGSFSTPVQSSTGWHIIKRISKPSYGSFEEEKGRLQSKVERDTRFQEARVALIKKIKSEGNYKVNKKVLSGFVSRLDKDFFTTKWRAPKKSKDILFSFGASSNYELGTFTDYLLRSAKKRISLGRNADKERVINLLLESFSDDMALQYERTQLSKKYPDFRNLMREYEEGIILFEVTKMLIWDKAAKDTVGLASFYEKNKENYLWGERAEISTYNLRSQSEQILAKVRKLAKKKPSSVVLKKINKKGNLLTVTTGSAEKGKKQFPNLDDMNWKKGTLSLNNINNDNTVSFVKIEKTLPRKRKELKDARGYVIADFQNQLEKEWIEQLRKEYPVIINKTALNSIIK